MLAKTPKIYYNSGRFKGKQVILNAREQRICDINQRYLNALGYEVNLTSLTTIVKEITEQKFFQIPPADYVPIRVGNGAWSSNLLTYRSFQIGDDFETGIINLGGNNSRLASTDAAVDSVPVKVINWAKENAWTIFDLEEASRSGNWDLVTAKEESRKTNWDLGIQRVAFLGAKGDSSALGLLNQVGITVDTTTIPQSIASMTPTQLKTFQSTIIEVYRQNCNRTAWPTHLIIPESDYNGLTGQASPDFPIKSTLQVLEEAFAVATRNKNFKILPLAYCDMQYSGQSYQQYVMLNYDAKSIRMDIPVDYTNTLANSVNNFQFMNVGYGQFTGCMAYRPDELMYFEYTPS